MNDTEFRAILDWWMCSDPFRPVDAQVIVRDWLVREAGTRGYNGVIDAFHRHRVNDASPKSEVSKDG